MLKDVFARFLVRITLLCNALLCTALRTVLCTAEAGGAVYTLTADSWRKTSNMNWSQERRNLFKELGWLILSRPGGYEPHSHQAAIRGEHIALVEGF